MDLNTEILKGFNINATHIKKVKGMYICSTKNGTKIIKSTNQSLDKIIENQKIIKYLENSDIKTLDKYKLSADELPYFNFRDQTYVCSDYLPHEKNNFTSESQFLRVIEMLASFHKITVKTNIKIINNSLLQQTFNNNLRDLKALKKRVSKQNQFSNFDLSFIKNYEVYTEFVKEGCDALNNSYFSEKIGFALENNSITHNLVKEENFIEIGSSFYINNFTQINSDVQIIDLGDVIQRHIKLCEKSTVPLDVVLERYDSINPINSEDVKIIKAIVAYPKRFVKTILNYYTKNRTWTPTGLENKLEDELKRKYVYKEYVK